MTGAGCCLCGASEATINAEAQVRDRDVFHAYTTLRASGFFDSEARNIVHQGLEFARTEWGK